MLKKTLLIGAAVALLGVLASTPFVSTHARTLWNSATKSVGDLTTIEYELEHTRTLIGELDPAIHDNAQNIARQEVEVERLAGQVEAMRLDQTKRESDIKRLKADIDSGTSVLVYSGREYTRQQVKNDVVARFEKFEAKEETLKQKEQILDARMRALRANKDKLAAMQQTKSQLEIEVENLEAQLESLRLAQAEDQYCFDDGSLGAAKEQLDKVRTRIEVAQKMANAEVTAEGEIPLDSEPVIDHDEDVLSRIDSRFGDSSVESVASIELDD